jgi:hypothetical protein
MSYFSFDDPFYIFISTSWGIILVLQKYRTPPFSLYRGAGIAGKPDNPVAYFTFEDDW